MVNAVKNFLLKIRLYSVNLIEDLSSPRKMVSKMYLKFLVFRWLILFLLACIYFVSSGVMISNTVFFQLAGFSIIYNFLVTVFILKNFSIKKTLSVVFYIDVIFISIFSAVLGGLNSDTYIILFFIICYYGINRNTTHIFNISAFCVISYSLFTVIITKNKGTHIFNYQDLIIRNLFIIFISYGIFLAVSQIKRYHDLHRKEFALARTDKLTGLPNRHYLEQKLIDEVLYSEYSGSPLNVLIFDLDNFKKFNDTYGHMSGDKLLTIFADIIRQNIRKEDIPIRFGGEEFLILIRDLNLEMAKMIGDRIRTQLEKEHIYVHNGKNRRKVTASCGIAQYPIHSKNIKEVINLADKALYHAKEIGKNTIVVYGDFKEIPEIKVN